MPNDFENISDSNGDETLEESLSNDNSESASDNNIYFSNTFSRHGYSMELLRNVLILMVTKLRHNLTYAATEDMSKLFYIKENDFRKHISKYHFKQILNKFSTILSIHHICNNCGHYAGKQLSIDNEQEILCCQHCQNDLNTKKNIESDNIFLYLSLTEQLKEKMETSNKDILYRDKRIKKVSYAIEDIFDGMLYEKASESCVHWSNTITITFGFDGVPIFESSNYSAHPILCMINEFSPKERRKHMMLCSVWCGKGKPLVNDYFIPFVAECQVLNEQGFKYIYQGQKYIKKVQLILGVCDSVARPMVQLSTQFNGEYGCSLCMHRGKQITKGKGTVRIYPLDLNDNLYGEGIRTHEATLIHAEEKNKGLKGKSILFDVAGFNIVSGLPPDWMHCVALGVCRQFAKLWFDSKNHEKDFYLGTALNMIDSLLLTYKPTLDVSRTPRKISEYKYWKAHEWAIWLLFYSIPTLKGLLPPRYINHWSLLVEGVALLLKTSILLSETYHADDLLLEFIKEVNELYGEENISFNVHILSHLAQSVRDWGPLWSHSAFGFEDFNGEVRKSVKSSQGVSLQICDNFRLKYAVIRLQCICEKDLSNFERQYIEDTIQKKSQPFISQKVINAQMVGLYKICKLPRQHFLALQRINI